MSAPRSSHDFGSAIANRIAADWFNASDAYCQPPPKLPHPRSSSSHVRVGSSSGGINGRGDGGDGGGDSDRYAALRGGKAGQQLATATAE